MSTCVSLCPAGGRRYLPPHPGGITPVFWKTRAAGRETSLQGTKLGLPASAGPSPSFLRLLGRPSGLGGPGGVLSNCSSTEKEMAGSGPTAPCRLVAWPCCQPSQLNRIQLWPRSLTLTNTVLGQLVAPTVGTPAPRLQPKAGLEGPWVNAIPAVTAEQAGGQWGGRCWSRRWGTQDSEGGRSGGRAFRDFSSAGLEVGQAGGGGAEAPLGKGTGAGERVEDEPHRPCPLPSALSWPRGIISRR